MKNMKKVFFVFILLSVLLVMSTVSATDDDRTISCDTPVVSDVGNDVVSTEQVQSTYTNEKVVNTKNIEKEDNTIKEDSITIHGVEYNSIYENQDVELDAVEDSTYFNNCTFNNYIEFYSNVYINNSIFNAENYGDNPTIILNNTVLNSYFEMTSGNLYIYNSTINGFVEFFDYIEIEGSSVNALVDASVIRIDENTVLGPNFTVGGNNQELILPQNTNTGTTIDVNNYYELTTAINNAVNDTQNNEYIINLNEGIYQITKSTLYGAGISTPNIIINANGQTLSASNIRAYTRFDNGCTITINNATITHIIQNYANNITIMNSILSNNFINRPETTLTLKNSTINKLITNNGTLIIDDDCILAENFEYSGNGTIISNKTIKFEGNIEVNNENITRNITIPETGNITFNNCNITGQITNNANATFTNSTINSTIINNGAVTISDDTIFGEKFKLNGTGEVVINDSDRLLPFSSVLNGSYVFENMNLPNFRYNYGNLTLINCTVDTTYLSASYGGVDYYSFDYIYNEGNMCILNGTNLMANLRNLGGNVCVDNSYLSNLKFYGYGNINISNIVLNPNNTSSTSWDYGKNADYDSNVIIRNITTVNVGSRLFSISDYTCRLNISMFDCQFINSTDAGIRSQYLIMDNCSFINCTITSNGFVSGYDINISNVLFEGNHIEYGGSVSGAIVLENVGSISKCTFKNNHLNITFGGLITVLNSSTITNCIFDNNTKTECSNNTYIETRLFNGVCIRATPNGNNTVIIQDNVFSNNFLDGSEGTITSTHYYTNDLHTNAYGTDISVDALVNHPMGSNIDVIIRNNSFINSTTTQKAGAIFVNYNQTRENNTLEITGNTFVNVRSKSETIIHNNTDEVLIADNTYTNCSIDVDEFVLSSPVDGSIIAVGDEISLTFNATLLNPEYYDEDIIKYYAITVNDSIVGGTSENVFTYTPESYGTLSIRVSSPALEYESNEVIVHVNSYDLTVNPVMAELGSTTTITTNVLVNDENIDDGRVYFTLNGKILRDTVNGKILYADVTGGVATLSGVNVTKAWNEDTEIVAVYQSHGDIPQFTSQAVNPTITYPETTEPTLMVSNVMTTAGNEVAITITMKDLTSGKVVLKVNGKTVKTDDGKLYSKVSGDTITFTYSVPKTLKSGDYTIKAVYTSGASKLESEGLLTVE